MDWATGKGEARRGGELFLVPSTPRPMMRRYVTLRCEATPAPRGPSAILRSLPQRGSKKYKRYVEQTHKQS
eukprot:8461466-Heterocapsa_arctica.AAC.1